VRQDRAVTRLPAGLDPTPGDRGVASADAQQAGQRALAAWDAFLTVTEAADLSAPARAKGRTGREVVLPLGSWPESRSLDEVLDDARNGRLAAHHDQDEVDERVRAAHRDAGDAEALDAVRAARDNLAGWLAAGDPEGLALRETRSVLGPLPVLTYLHATAYHLAVCALDLEPCGTRADPALLTAGVIALVDTTGALAARQGVTGSITAVLPHGTWGFASRGPDWRTARLSDGAPTGPAVEADPRVIVDVTAGRVANVPHLWRRRELVTHDLPGLLRLAPVIEQVPGIPGGLALRTASRYLGAVGWLLRR
jgi:hypothetical protein